MTSCGLSGLGVKPRVTLREGGVVGTAFLLKGFPAVREGNFRGGPATHKFPFKLFPFTVVTNSPHFGECFLGPNRSKEKAPSRGTICPTARPYCWRTDYDLFLGQ